MGVFSAALALALVWAAPASAVNRFAAPNGTGVGTGGAGSCTQSSPQGPELCSAAQAFAVLAPGDDLTLLGGTNYPAIESGPFNVDANATVHGTPGAPVTFPTTETAGTAFQVQGGAVLRDVRVVGTDLDTGIQIFDNGMIDRVFVDADTSPGANACVAVNNGAVFRDSVCWTQGASGAGVSLGAAFGVTNVVTLRNVTAASTGSNGVGIRANATNVSSNLTVYATNTIALGDDSGTLADVFAQTDGAVGAQASVVLDHSNYSSADVLNGGSATAPGTASNVSTPPVFVNPAVGLFGEQATSTGTIDRGTAATVNGVGTASLALSGQPRCLGAAPDIGAEEFAAAACAPPAAAVPPKKCKKGRKLKKGKCVKKKRKKRKKRG